ncbi:hypothetical protein ACLKA7_007618 [Drosophila subpalustris]
MASLSADSSSCLPSFGALCSALTGFAAPGHPQKGASCLLMSSVLALLSWPTHPPGTSPAGDTGCTTWSLNNREYVCGGHPPHPVLLALAGGPFSAAGVVVPAVYQRLAQDARLNTVRVTLLVRHGPLIDGRDNNARRRKRTPRQGEENRVGWMTSQTYSLLFKDQVVHPVSPAGDVPGGCVGQDKRAKTDDINRQDAPFWGKEEGGGALLVLGIDEMAKNNIVARGHQLFFRFGKISVSGLKRVAERDGMRATPAPSGATAPVSEDPPPRESIRRCPAASGSRLSGRSVRFIGGSSRGQESGGSNTGSRCGREDG